MYDLLLKNGSPFDIAIHGGKIVKINDHISEPAKQTIDCFGKHILPGMIDIHVHCRTPGGSMKETFATASSSAAAGGVTTIADMPNTSPPTITKKALDEKRELAAEQGKVNILFHFGVTDDNFAEVKRVCGEEDVIGFKCYLGETTGNILIRDFRTLEKMFQIKDKVFVIHADRYVKEVLELAEKFHARVHITHISTKADLDRISRFNLRGRLNLGFVTCDVTPHHLFFDEHEIDRQGALVKVNPPLATREDQEALWQGIDDGTISMIASDHAPHLMEEKKRPFADAPAGVPGLETTLPLLLNTTNQGRLTLEKVVSLISETPAKIFTIKNKGRLEVGCDADVTVVDMNLEQEVRNEKLFTKCGFSPFAGWKLKGWPVMTIVSGKVIYWR